MSVLTGDNPYTSTAQANGYFCTWVGFVGAGMFFYVTVGSGIIPDASAVIDNVSLFGIFVASGVEMLSAAIGCRQNQCSDNLAYAVALGVVSVFLCFAIVVTKNNDLQKWGSAFLLLWWIPGSEFNFCILQ